MDFARSDHSIKEGLLGPLDDHNVDRVFASLSFVVIPEESYKMTDVLLRVKGRVPDSPMHSIVRVVSILFSQHMRRLTVVCPHDLVKILQRCYVVEGLSWETFSVEIR